MKVLLSAENKLDDSFNSALFTCNRQRFIEKDFELYLAWWHHLYCIGIIVIGFQLLHLRLDSQRTSYKIRLTGSHKSVETQAVTVERDGSMDYQNLLTDRLQPLLDSFN